MTAMRLIVRQLSPNGLIIFDTIGDRGGRTFVSHIYSLAVPESRVCWCPMTMSNCRPHDYKVEEVRAWDESLSYF